MRIESVAPQSSPPILLCGGGEVSKTVAVHAEEAGDKPLILSEQIRFIDQEQIPLRRSRSTLSQLSLPNNLPIQLQHILCQVLRTERKRITSVDNLNNQVGSLASPPQLSPDFQITFERRQK